MSSSSAVRTRTPSDLLQTATAARDSAAGLPPGALALAEVSPGEHAVLLAKPAANSTHSRLPKAHSSHAGFLYVYENPLLSDQRAMSMAQRMDALYAGELHFYRSLMSDPSLRARSRENASLFYVPTWAPYQVGNVAYAKNRGHFTGLLQAMLKQPGFESTWSANMSAHVFFFGGDKGACAVGRGPIFMQHWGLQVPWKHMVHVPAGWRPPNASLEAALDEQPCADDHDLIVPPSVEAHFDPAALATSPPGGWNCELFFAGAPNYTLGRSSACGDPLHPAGWQRCYAQGLRALVFEHHGRRERFCLSPTGKRTAYELARRSRFCLAPSGEGFGNRCGPVS